MEQTEKRAQILEAAIRRFAHFGVHKTTLSEIAEDLGMTKQALAYYFSDKQSLSDAVEEQIVEEFFNLVEDRFAGASGLEQALTGIVEVKKTFFEKYALLMQAAASEAVLYHSRVAGSKKKARERLVQLIARLLEQGMARGELKSMNPAEVGALICDTMNAFEQCAVSRQAVPDPKVFADLYHRQKAVVQLLVNGLKNEAWKN